MRLLKNLKNRRDFFVLFFVLLIPNILRQILYYSSYIKTGSTDFITSFETKAIYGSNIFLLGVAEEVIIGLAFVVLWFSYDKLKFLGYGWIGDAFIDFIFVGTWFLIGQTPLQLLGLNDTISFILREIVFSYGIIGILLYKRKADIKKISFIVTLAGLLVLILI